MTNILFTNTNCSWNKGSAAQVISTIKILKKYLPNASFTMISFYPSLDIKYSNKYDIKIVGYFHSTLFFEPLLYGCHILLSLFRCIFWKVLCKLRFNARALLNEKYLQAYMNADIIIDLSGDSFADNKISSTINCIGLIPGILLRKPIVLFSQSIGPFKMITYPLVKFCLNKASLITARGQITKNYLEDLQINTPIFLGSDCAFILKAAPHEVVNKILCQEGITKSQDRFIGLSVSAILNKKNKDYVPIMAQTIDYLTQRLNTHVILISHAFLPTEDDRPVVLKIYNKVVNKNKVWIVKNEYSTEKLKGLIGLCDIFISSRMHAGIAALSTCIPTIVLSWSHKYYEIMASLGHEKYICEINTITFQELTSKIDELWRNRSKIRTELTSKIRIQRKLALFGGKLIEEMLIKREV